MERLSLKQGDDEEEESVMGRFEEVFGIPAGHTLKQVHFHSRAGDDTWAHEELRQRRQACRALRKLEQLQYQQIQKYRRRLGEIESRRGTFGSGK